MEFLKKFDFKNVPIARIIGVGLLVVVVLTVAIWLLGFAFRTAFFGTQAGGGPGGIPSIPARGGVAYDEAYDGRAAGLSVQQKVSRPIVPPFPGGSTGIDAEEFEVTEYFASVRTARLDERCDTVEGLKSRADVIFENANRHDRGCSYSFKVKNESAESVLSIVKGLDPDVLRENTYTIKPVVESFENEITILEKKLASVEETLTEAGRAYDEVTVLATRAQDVESLAKIIDSKVRLIERLTQERINIKTQIDRLAREKFEQEDRLNFTFFNVSISEILLFDFKSIKDSWIAEFQQFVREFNDVIQDVTVNLAEFLLRVAQAAIYFVLALFVVKYGWFFTKKLWRL